MRDAWLYARTDVARAEGRCVERRRRDGHDGRSLGGRVIGTDTAVLAGSDGRGKMVALHVVVHVDAVDAVDEVLLPVVCACAHAWVSF